MKQLEYHVKDCVEVSNP